MVGVLRTVLREQVKAMLLHRIVAGELQAGERLVETRIAQELGTSQAPVREARKHIEQFARIMAREGKNQRKGLDMSPVVLVVRFRAAEGQAEVLWEALVELAEASRQEPGCIVYDPCRDPDEPERFFLYERYTGQAALDAHRETPHFVAIVKGRFPALVGEMDRTLYTDVLS